MATKQEQRVRRIAGKQGLRLRKSLLITKGAPRGFVLINLETGATVFGLGRLHGARLAEVEQFLAKEQEASR